MEYIENFNFDSLFRFPNESQFIYDIICPLSNGQIPDILADLSNFSPLLSNLSNPVCDNAFLTDALENGVDYIERYYSLATHAEFCRYNL